MEELNPNKIEGHMSFRHKALETLARAKELRKGRKYEMVQVNKNTWIEREIKPIINNKEEL